MQLHVFERTIFRRHQIILYFICFYLTVSIVTLLAWTQYKLFFADCGYQWSNYDHFAEVLSRVVVPTKPQCRYYPDGLNLTVANASALHVMPNLTTVLKHCTFSFNSLWK